MERPSANERLSTFKATLPVRTANGGSNSPASTSAATTAAPFQDILSRRDDAVADDEDHLMAYVRGAREDGERFLRRHDLEASETASSPSRGAIAVRLSMVPVPTSSSLARPRVHTPRTDTLCQIISRALESNGAFDLDASEEIFRTTETRLQIRQAKLQTRQALLPSQDLPSDEHMANLTVALSGMQFVSGELEKKLTKDKIYAFDKAAQVPEVDMKRMRDQLAFYEARAESPTSRRDALHNANNDLRAGRMVDHAMIFRLENHAKYMHKVLAKQHETNLREQLVMQQQLDAKEQELVKERELRAAAERTIEGLQELEDNNLGAKRRRTEQAKVPCWHGSSCINRKCNFSHPGRDD